VHEAQDVGPRVDSLRSLPAPEGGRGRRVLRVVPNESAEAYQVSKLTNARNLPEALLKAMQNDPYSSGGSDFTATSLLKPARLRALEERHQA
jgi:hypothetical protein